MVEDTPVPNSMLSLDFGAVVMAISSSPSSGPSWKAHSEGVSPGVGCRPPLPAAVPDRVPVPAVREQAAHTPLRTLLSHLKTNQLLFLREGGGIQAALGVIPADSWVLCCLCVEQGADLFPGLSLVIYGFTSDYLPPLLSIQQCGAQGWR